MACREGARVKGRIAVGAVAISIAAGLVTKWEGVRYVPYADVGGVLTVCYGHTGKDVVGGRTYSEDECDALRDADLAVASAVVKHCLPMPMLPQIEGAMTSATFNAGPGVVCDSTIQRKALANDWPSACAALDLWKYVGRTVSQGLVNRRADERAVCEGRP